MTTKADRTRNLRYKRPALASLGLDIITMEMAEITEACADILWAINDVFSRYGAESFAYATTSGKAILAFQIHGKQIRISVSLPKIEDFRLTENGRVRTAGSQREAWEKATRQIWRVLLLLIKAKLEAIENGISTMDHEFMADIMLPNGQTVGEYVMPQIRQAYITGNMPPLLLLAGMK